MPSLTADTAAMRQKAKALEEHAAEYDSLRNRLLSAATSMGSAYQSADNLTFVANITEFCQQLKLVSDRLRNSGDVLKMDADDYDRTEADNAGEASKLP